MSYRVGDIVHVSGLPIVPQKGKYCVLITVGPNQFLLINTENRKMYDCIPLEKKGREFPVYDSFIGCKNVYTALDEQVDRKVGELDNSEVQAVFSKIETSKFIPKIQKGPILAALKAELEARNNKSSK